MLPVEPFFVFLESPGRIAFVIRCAIQHPGNLISKVSSRTTRLNAHAIYPVPHVVSDATRSVRDTGQSARTGLREHDSGCFRFGGKDEYISAAKEIKQFTSSLFRMLAYESKHVHVRWDVPRGIRANYSQFCLDSSFVEQSRCFNGD